MVIESASQPTPAGLGFGTGAGAFPPEAGAGVLPTSAVPDESPEHPHSIAKLSWEKGTKVPPTKPGNEFAGGGVGVIMILPLRVARKRKAGASCLVQCTGSSHA